MTLQEKLQKYPPVLSVKDLEEILRISHNTAYALVRSGQIHSVRTGRSYRIPINDIIHVFFLMYVTETEKSGQEKWAARS